MPRANQSDQRKLTMLIASPIRRSVIAKKLGATCLLTLAASLFSILVPAGAIAQAGQTINVNGGWYMS